MTLQFGANAVVAMQRLVAEWLKQSSALSGSLTRETVSSSRLRLEKPRQSCWIWRFHRVADGALYTC